MFNQLISSCVDSFLTEVPFPVADGCGGAKYADEVGLVASTILGFTAPGPNVLTLGLETPRGKIVTLLPLLSRAWWFPAPPAMRAFGNGKSRKDLESPSLEGMNLGEGRPFAPGKMVMALVRLSASVTMLRLDFGRRIGELLADLLFLPAK